METSEKHKNPTNKKQTWGVGKKKTPKQKQKNEQA